MTVLQDIQVSLEIWCVFFFIAAAVTVFVKRGFDRRGAAVLVCLMLDSALLMVCDSAVKLFAGVPGVNSRYAAQTAAFGAFFFAFLTMPLMTEYLTFTVRKRAEVRIDAWRIAEWTLFFINTAVLIVNIFYRCIYTFDDNNAYCRLPFAYFSDAVMFAGIFAAFAFVLRSFKHLYVFEKIAAAIGLVVPTAALFVQICNYNISFVNLSLAISSLLLFASYELNCQSYNAERNKNLAEERIRLFNSQIRPHFLFNCLTVIKRLCRQSPNLVPETIDEFSRYLRCCTDLMNSNDCIPVTRELDLVNHYVYMQTKRFDDAIVYKFDIQDTEFDIPPFAVQICVENAIEHGLRIRKIEKATVSVRTYRTNKAHIIEVEDNGVGFDTAALTNDGETEHIGIKNTRERLMLMCGGTMKIDSVAEKGTKVTISIPQSQGRISRRKTKNEDFNR